MVIATVHGKMMADDGGQVEKESLIPIGKESTPISEVVNPLELHYRADFSLP